MEDPDGLGMVTVGALHEAPGEIPPYAEMDKMEVGKPGVIQVAMPDAQSALKKFAHSTAPAVAVTKAPVPGARSWKT